MEQHKESDAVLAFDLLYTTNHIQMFKAALPYAPRQTQPMFAVFIKYMELAYTLSCIRQPLLPDALNGCEQYSGKASIPQLISTLEQYLTEQEKKKLERIKDMMKNLEQMKEMQKVMELLHPSEGSDANLFSGFMPTGEDFNKSSIEQTIAQIFSTLNT